MPLGVQYHSVVDAGANNITGRFNLLVGLKGCPDRHLVNWNHSGIDFISGVEGGRTYRVDFTKQKYTAVHSVHSDSFRGWSNMGKGVWFVNQTYGLGAFWKRKKDGDSMFGDVEHKRMSRHYLLTKYHKASRLTWGCDLIYFHKKSVANFSRKCSHQISPKSDYKKNFSPQIK